ncbi:growth factor receptor-bound protein 14 isoform X4 [Mixophyes fleayi]|uniref:growth factor receptor-bound protein 14 isoform X4 n=1 Tax=Mixophyes fleayi TaxID=3061075 RepID=UPI003F4DAFEC
MKLSGCLEGQWLGAHKTPDEGCEERTNPFQAALVPLQVIKVFSEDGTSRALEVPNDITALNVCQLLIQKNHYIDDQNWTLIEQLSTLCLERILEDHELVIEVQSKWDMEEDCRFCFRKYYTKYEFFKNPENYFPDLMLSYSSEVNGAAKSVDTIKMFLSTSTYPEVHGYLYMSEKGKKSWKKLFFVLRRSGLYFSTKGTSKDPRHLQFFSDFSQSNVYMLLSARKVFGAPTDYGLCLKPNKTGGTKEMKLLCAESEGSKICWMTAIRLYKLGDLILYVGWACSLSKYKRINQMYCILSLASTAFYSYQQVWKEDGEVMPIEGAILLVLMPPLGSLLLITHNPTTQPNIHVHLGSCPLYNNVQTCVHDEQAGSVLLGCVTPTYVSYIF